LTTPTFIEAGTATSFVRVLVLGMKTSGDVAPSVYITLARSEMNMSTPTSKIQLPSDELPGVGSWELGVDAVLRSLFFVRQSSVPEAASSNR
jgi:hypothetical protein